MSRSRHQTPIIGNASAASEKYDKQRASQRERKWIGDHLKVHKSTDPDFDLVTHDEHPRSGGFIFAKDGKGYIGKRSPELLRK